MKRIQSHPGTLVLRHKMATHEIIETLRPLGRDARLLCFGASWGAEVVPFALALPEATIVAAEIEPKALEHGSKLFEEFDNVEILKSTWDDIASRGPYDAICCNAVLCKYPAARDTDNLSEAFPFSEFEDMLGRIVANLKSGAPIVLYNTNYSPLDSDLFSDFVPHYMPPSPSYLLLDNFVCQFDRAGNKLAHVIFNGPTFGIELSKHVPIETPSDRSILIRRINEGVFVKSPTAERRTALAKIETGFDVGPAAFGRSVPIDLNAVYRMNKPHKDSYTSIPIKQCFGLSPQGTEFGFTLWWEDQLLALPG